MVTTGGSTRDIGHGSPPTPSDPPGPRDPPSEPPPPTPDGQGRMRVFSMNRRGSKPQIAAPVIEALRKFSIGKRLPSLFARLEHPRASRDTGVEVQNVPPVYTR